MCIRDRVSTQSTWGISQRSILNIMRSKIVLLLCLAVVFTLATCKSKKLRGNAQPAFVEPRPEQPYVPTYGHVHKLIDSYYHSKPTFTPHRDPDTVPYGRNSGPVEFEPRRRTTEQVENEDVHENYESLQHSSYIDPAENGDELGVEGRSPYQPNVPPATDYGQGDIHPHRPPADFDFTYDEVDTTDDRLPVNPADGLKGRSRSRRRMKRRRVIPHQNVRSSNDEGCPSQFLIFVAAIWRDTFCSSLLWTVKPTFMMINVSQILVFRVIIMQSLLSVSKRSLPQLF
eukprot:TRINITY_DN2643_c0_g1_i1.p1 TRINITY_DN2643_c0_g1~~TRINITY_DN2643_c0_g1_i1.p1  ORF type:complete len:286 (-),score=68.19 TRINITY_DN2643_c0_g1_i1:198-1055(-)